MMADLKGRKPGRPKREGPACETVVATGKARRNGRNGSTDSRVTAASGLPTRSSNRCSVTPRSANTGCRRNDDDVFTKDLSCTGRGDGQAFLLELPGPGERFCNNDSLMVSHHH